MYEISEVTVRQSRQAIANHFRRNKVLNDTTVIDLLRCRAEMELQEALRKYKVQYYLFLFNFIKVRRHVLKYIQPAPEELMKTGVAAKSPFLAQFLQGSR